jgi:substrate import-associated zinc metallohydrolase lipoprotein
MKKKYYFIWFIAGLFGLAFDSCSNGDDLDYSTSVITDSHSVTTPLDAWLKKNFVEPYNVELRYRFDDNEIGMDYWLSPASYEKSIWTAKLIKYLCFDVYDEVTGSTAFLRSNFPKIVQLVGTAGYNSNGTMKLGSAEGGYRIDLLYINSMKIERAFLNQYYFHTIHHEFSHIFHQKTPYPSEFKEISGSDYKADNWSSEFSSNEAAESAGFITPYASKEANEDFAELFSTFILSTDEEWAAKIAAGGNVGGPIIQKKMNIICNYMIEQWGLDLKKVRAAIVKRIENLDSLDLNSLTTE